MEKKLNVILDIDETFVQFGEYGDWLAIPEDQRKQYDRVGFEDGKGGWILRPGFDEFFTRLFKLCRSVNIWTLSDPAYAKDVVGIIKKRVPGAIIKNVWADIHNTSALELDSINKDLNYIWYEEGKFNPCDTILIDDLPENTNNAANKHNGIQLKPFDPLGKKLEGSALAEGKASTPKRIRTGRYTDQSKDDTLLRVIEFLEANNNKVCDVTQRPFTEHTKIGVSEGGRRKKTRRRAKKRMTRRRR